MCGVRILGRHLDPADLSLASATDLAAYWPDRRADHSGIEEVLGLGDGVGRDADVVGDQSNVLPYEPTEEADVRRVRPWSSALPRQAGNPTASSMKDR